MSLPASAMVYISSWQEYQEAAEALYEKSPNTVSTFLRFCASLLTRSRISDTILREVEAVG